MTTWASEELQSVELGDQRLNNRLKVLVETLASCPEGSIPQACNGDPAGMKAAYRFFDNDRIDASKIMAGHVASTCTRCEDHDTVLAIQDTTSLDFTQHPGTHGLGYLEADYLRGIKVHSVFGVSPEGVPLGILHQTHWVRDDANYGQTAKRRQKRTAAKESQRWLEAQAATLAALPEDQKVVTIADREADLYDFLALPRREGQEFLIRAAQNRVVAPSQKLFETVADWSPTATLELSLGRRDGKPPRTADLSLRYGNVTIQAPTNRAQAHRGPGVSLTALEVREFTPPPGEAPIHWLLLTTLLVRNVADAVQYLTWYSFRWLIERYHYVLKSGCGVEQLALQTADRLWRAFAVYSIVAWRLLWLTYQARQTPQASCEVALESEEWQALYGLIHQTETVPSTPPTLSEAVRWLAQLGGFLGRRGDGEPGVKTIWRGLTRLQDMVAIWRLLHST